MNLDERKIDLHEFVCIHVKKYEFLGISMYLFLYILRRILSCPGD
jgi:hypothetical protein